MFIIFKNIINKGFKVLVILALIITFTYGINNTDKKLMLETYSFSDSVQINGIASKDEEEKPKPKPLITNVYYGDLTGYSADCPLCNGTLACARNYNVYQNNVVTYYDNTYGNVRIVASSKNLPCGSIVKINSSRVPGSLAIVLDRGVLGNDLDLLVPTEQYAIQYVGRSRVSYEVLRRGW